MVNDSGEPGGGGRLRWWQDEEQAAKSKGARWYSTPPVAPEVTAPVQPQAVTSQPLDIVEELEAEARQRSLQEQQHRSQEWVVEGSYGRAVKNTRNRLLAVYALGAALELGLYFMTHLPVLLGLTAFLTFYFALLYFIVYKNMSKLPPLRIGLSPVGISVAGANYSGHLRWTEIKSVERRTFSGQKFIVVQPTDPVAMERFSYTKRGEKLRRLRKRLRKFYQKMPEAVYIQESTLPMTADAFLTRLASFQSAPVSRQG